MKFINVVCHTVKVLLLFCCISNAFSQDFLSFAWSGGVTDSSAVVVVKTKLAPSTGGVIIVSSNADLSSPVYTSANTLVDANIIRFEDIVGLSPNTSYYYGVKIDGVLDSVLNDTDNGLDPYTGTFKTMPVPGTAASYNFIFGCSIRSNPLGNAEVFDTIKNKGPIFWMSTGDFHYGDVKINDPAAFRSQFDKRLVSGGTGTKLASLSRALPFVFMWDDHDFGPNNSHGAGVTNSYKQAAHKVFREYIPYHDLNLAGDAAYTLGEEPIARAFTVGRIRYILTDLRSESTRNIGTGEMKLGTTQKAWFKEELIKANGTYPVIVWVTSIPWNGDNDDTKNSSKDGWQYFIDEREEIANFLNDNHITGFFALSGDMHGMAIDDGTNTDFTSAGNGSGFPLFHASPLSNKSGSYKAGPYSEGQAKGTTGGTMFGMVDFTDDGDTITVQMTAKDQDDTTVIATNDNIGNHIAYSFTQSNPLLVSLIPADDSSGASVTADLEVNFSENIIAGTTGNVQLYNAANDSIIETIAITSLAISISNNSLSINPTTDLPSNTSIYVSIVHDAVFDASSNAFAGISVPTGVAYKKWNFTTGSIITATESDGTYNIGDTIDITIQFDNIVTVTGIPQLTLETGTTDAVVDYTSGSGTDTLTFTYTVASGHTNTDLDYVSTTALSLNGGTIQNADLTLPTPGTTDSLGANKDLIIDAVLLNAPTYLTANPVSQTQINLSWTDNSTDESGFKIERAGSLITTTAADAIKYSDSGLSCGTTYSYSIKATNANGDSIAVTSSATTEACPSENTSNSDSSSSGGSTPLPNAMTIFTKFGGLGSGTITSEPGGINCKKEDTECKATFATTSKVKLTATADVGSEFNTWVGEDCDKEMFLTKHFKCTAYFKLTPRTLTVDYPENGVITSSLTGIDCGNECSSEFEGGKNISLTAIPNVGYMLDSWSENCPDGKVQLLKNTTCVATFKVKPAEPVIITPVDPTVPDVVPPTTGTDLVVPTATNTVSFSKLNYEVAENAGSINITVNRIGTVGEVNVDLLSSDDSGKADIHYRPINKTLFWANGDDIEITVPVEIIDNSEVDGDKTVTLSLGNADNAKLRLDTVVLIIVDDDEVPVIIQPEPITPSPIVPIITEEPVVTMQDEFATVVTPTTSGISSPMIGNACNNSSSKLAIGCNARAETISYREVEEHGSLAEGILDHLLTSEGLVSNTKITPDGSLKGGKISGYTNNEGMIEDVKFVGASISGKNAEGEVVGIIGGKIVLASKIGGVVEDVRLAPNTHIVGIGTPLIGSDDNFDRISGTIIGDSEKPATLTKLHIKTKSIVSNVIVDENVTYSDDVTFTNVKFRTRVVQKVILKGRINGTRFKETYTKVESVTIRANSHLSNLEIGVNVIFEDGVTLGENISFSVHQSYMETHSIAGLPNLTGLAATDSQGNEVSTWASLQGGVRLGADAENYHKKVTFKRSKQKKVEIHGNVLTDIRHIGQSADIVVYAYHTPPGATSPTSYMIDSGGMPLPWDGDMSSLVPFQAEVSLTPVVPVLIWNNPLDIVGDVQVYFGYRLLENGELVYSLEDVIEMEFTE